MSAILPINVNDRMSGPTTATAGQTVFSYDFPIQAETDIAVIKIDANNVETTLSLGIDYTVSGISDTAGGSITLTIGAKAGDQYIRVGQAVLQRVLSIVRAGRYNSAATDDDFDRTMLIAQEHRRELDRSWKTSFGKSGGRITKGASGQVAIFDAHGNVVGADPIVGGLPGTNSIGPDALQDSAVSRRAMAAAIIDSALITDDPTEWDAISDKLRILSKADVDIYVDPLTGNDATGTGAQLSPLKTPQAAYDQYVRGLQRHRCIVHLANGNYSENSRNALSMDRPALIYCDKKSTSLRTDAPAGVLHGGIVFVGDSKAGVVLKPDGTFKRAVYITGGVGHIGFQNMTINAQAGAESGMVAHRPGVYLHCYDIDILGNNSLVFGVLAESQGQMEAINTTIDGCTVGAQTLAGGLIQFGLASDITNCTTGGTATGGGWLSFSAGTQCSSPLLAQDGGDLDCTGSVSSRVTITGSVKVINATWSGSYLDVSGGITTYPGASVRLGALGWSNSWVDYGGDLYLAGAKSWISPATQSNVVTPLLFAAGTKKLYVDATFQIINNAGTEISESVGSDAVSVPGSNGPISNVVLRNIINVANLTASAARTGITIPGNMAGRSAGAPPSPGTVLYVYNNSANGIQLVPGTTADFVGLASITIGTASTQYIGVLAVMGTTGLWRVTPIGAARP